MAAVGSRFLHRHEWHRAARRPVDVGAHDGPRVGGRGPRRAAGRCGIDPRAARLRPRCAAADARAAVRGLAPGRYAPAVFPHNTRSGEFETASTVAISVK
jgi:hypothetical protein